MIRRKLSMWAAATTSQSGSWRCWLPKLLGSTRNWFSIRQNRTARHGSSWIPVASGSWAGNQRSPWRMEFGIPINGSCAISRTHVSGEAFAVHRSPFTGVVSEFRGSRFGVLNSEFSFLFRPPCPPRLCGESSFPGFGVCREGWPPCRPTYSLKPPAPHKGKESRTERSSLVLHLTVRSIRPTFTLRFSIHEWTTTGPIAYRG